MYGHVRTLAEAEVKGIKAAGGSADLFQYEDPSHILKCGRLVTNRQLLQDSRDSLRGNSG